MTANNAMVTNVGLMTGHRNRQQRSRIEEDSYARLVINTNEPVNLGPNWHHIVRVVAEALDAAMPTTPEPDVPEEPIDWQGVLSNALCAYDDREKAEQGFGPLDTGWANPGSDHIAWWIEEFGAPAVRHAITDASKENT